MGGTAASTLIAVSGPLEVSSAPLSAPHDLNAVWVDAADHAFELRWSHPDTGGLDRFEVEETAPGTSPEPEYIVVAGSDLNLRLNRQSGPFGGYRYRVRACATVSGLARCSDWSEALDWIVADPNHDPGAAVHPWGSNAAGAGTLNTDRPFDYAMGYHFRPEVDGAVTELGGFFSGTFPVRLFRRDDGQLLAQATVSGSNDWNYTPIEPVRVSAGEEYTVAVYLDGSGGSFRASTAFPATFSGIRIIGSTYVYTEMNSLAIPVNVDTSKMYGQADIGFVAGFVAENLPPSITSSLPDRENRRGDVISLEVSTADPGGDDVTCSIQGLPAGLTAATDCRVGGTVTAAPGIFETVVTASDGRAQSQPVTFNWTVTAAAPGADPDTPPPPAARPSFAVDTASARVGATPGQAAVDSAGAANYSIPLVMARGSGGFTPALSLEYNSQLPNGVIGMGWTLNGRSVISRCAQTIEQDGNPSSAGIHFTHDDRFCLDGQRLMLVGGQYGRDGSEYRTEIDSFTRIVAYGSAGNGPRYFRAWSRDGVVSEFGNTADSRIEARADGDAATVVTWARNRVQDAAGNYALLEYDEKSGGPVDFELLTVRYTGNAGAGTTPYAEIRFDYATGRGDVPLSYAHSAAFAKSRLLTRIDSLAKINPGDAVMQSMRTYFLDYGEDGYGRKTLESLTECSDSSRSWCFPETRFTWLKNEHGIDSRILSVAGVFPDDMAGLGVADINGDGRADLLISRKSKLSSYFRIAFARETGGFDPQDQTYGIPSHGDLNTPVTLRTIDLNADGFQDVIYPRSVAGTIGWYARLSDGSGLGSETRVADGCCELLDPSVVRIMDYDGDGLADLVTNRHSRGNGDNGDLVLLRNAYEPGGTVGFEPYRALRIELTSALFPAGPTSGGWTRDDEAPQFVNANPASAVGAQPFDFNGDGRVDLVARLSRRYSKCELDCPLPIAGWAGGLSDSGFHFGSGQEGAPLDETAAKGVQYGHATFYVVFESLGEDEFREHSIIATGSGDDCNVPDACGPFARLPGAAKLVPVDINADGLADIAFMDAANDWHFMLNTGRGFLPPQSIAKPLDDADSENGAFVDVNGDAFPDFLHPSRKDDGEATWLLYTNDAGKAFSAAVDSRMHYGDPAGGDGSILLDFSGDGMLDNLFIDRGASGGARQRGPILQLGENLITGSLSQANSVITKITDGLGGVHQFDYRPLTGSVYTRMRNAGAADWGRQSPVFDLSAPVYVVGRHSQSSPTRTDPDALGSVEYHYLGARIQAGGRGFLGFAEIIAYDPASGIRTNTRYRQDFPYTGLVADTAVAVVSGSGRFGSISNPEVRYVPSWPKVEASTPPPANLPGTLLRYQANEWSAVETVPGSGAFYPQSTASLERRFTLRGRLSRKDLVTSAYDDYGQVVASSAQTWDSESGPAFLTRTTQNSYTAPDVSNWRLGQLSHSRTTHSRPGRPGLSRQTAFQYNDDNMRLVREIQEPGNPALELTRAFELDEFGNRVAVSITGAGLSPRETFSYHDALGRYVDREVNAFGQATSRVLQRDVFGTELRTANIDGVVSETVTEPLGRPFGAYHEAGSWSRSLRRFGRGSHCPQSTAYHAISRTGGRPSRITCHDRVGREIRTAVEGFDGSYVYTDRYFDLSGRLERESTPFFPGDPQFWTTYSYDALGRNVFTDSAAGDDLQYAWDTDAGNHCVPGEVGMVRTRNALGQDYLEVRNTLGEIVAVHDELCGRVSYEYDAMGQLVSTTGVDGSAIIARYDLAGRKILLDDPDKGLWRYAYNPLGELVRRLDAKGQAIDYEYDRLGRVVLRRETRDVASLTSGPGIVVNQERTTWENGTHASVAGKGQVTQVVYREGEAGEIVHQENLIYDDFGRLAESLTLIDGEQFSERNTFDQYGRPFQQFDASGDSRGLRFMYSQSGHLQQVRESREGGDGTVYQRIEAMDARGNVTRMLMGNGVEVFAGYDPLSGFLEKLEAYDAQGVELQEVDYLYDALGTLMQRRDRSNGRDLTEDYSYDKLNRLVRVELTAPADNLSSPTETMRLDYGANGNIRFKSDVGSYTYGQGNAGPHAVTWAGGAAYAYDGNGNQVSGGGRTITYSVFDQPLVIDSAGQRTAFEYGIANHRIKRVDDNDVDGARTTLYLGAVERISVGGEVRFRRDLAGSATADFYPATGNQDIRYFVKDHLGSIHNVTDESGSIANATWMGFDAFGQRVDLDWRSSLPLSTRRALADLSGRGFTGHEQVDGMGLIHMNGRIYDPKLGRFLQADPLVQNSRNSQSLNRYSYTFNNPLSYTDPSGYFSIKRFFERWGRLIVAAVVSYFTFGAASAWAWGLMPSTAAGVATTAAYTASTVIGAAISGFVGGAILSGNLKGAVKGAISGAVFAYLASQVKLGMQNWRSGRGQVYRVSYDLQSKSLSAQAISDPSSVKIDKLFVNGQSNDLQRAMSLGHFQLGEPAEFYLFHNPTHGFIADTVESTLGKITNTSSLSRQLAGILENQAANLTAVTAHSQGAIIVSNALRQVAEGSLSTSTTINFHGAGVGRRIHSRTTTRAGAAVGNYHANNFDLVPNVIGMATFNPIQIVGSILLAPLLVTSLSPHTWYHP
jgi:RHS repeat-associated protein